MREIKRLKGLKRIENLFAQGEKIYCSPIKIIYSTEQLEENHFIGVSVGKKNVGSAVERNKIKRILRENLKENHPLLKSHFRGICMMIIYASKEPVNKEKTLIALKKLLKKILRDNE